MECGAHHVLEVMALQTKSHAQRTILLHLESIQEKPTCKKRIGKTTYGSLKLLRIDDPAEASKSSVWDTLGIKPDEKGMFEPFKTKVLKNDKAPESPQALQANPAAFSRSQSFQERT